MDLNIWWAKTQFDAKTRLRTYRKVASMLKAGTQIERVLEDLYMRASDDGTKPNEGMAIIMNAWLLTIKNGGTFADAVKDWVPYSEHLVILSGEQSGDIPTQLLTLIRIVKHERTIKSTVRAGFLGPCAILVAVAAYLVLFGVMVIPQFQNVTDPATWRPLAKSLYYMSQFVIHFGLIAGIMLSLIIGWITWALPNFCGRMRVSLDRIVPFSIYKLVVGSGFMLSLVAMLRGGQRVQDALLKMSEATSPYMRSRLESILLGINSGASIGGAMKVSGYEFPSKEIIDDLAVYSEKTGDFTAALETIANEWMEDGVATIEMYTGFLKGAAILTLALIIMWIVSGFFAIQQEIAQMTRNMAH